MALYLLKRFGTMLLTLLIVSALVFFIIKLPPGDFLSNQIAELKAQGDASSVDKMEFLRKEYGLDQPAWVQYLTWVGLWPGRTPSMSIHQRRGAPCTVGSMSRLRALVSAW